MGLGFDSVQRCFYNHGLFPLRKYMRDYGVQKGDLALAARSMVAKDWKGWLGKMNEQGYKSLLLLHYSMHMEIISSQHGHRIMIYWISEL